MRLVAALTNVCRADCVFCYRQPPDSPDLLDFDEQLWPVIQELGARITIVRFAGACEPLLHPTFRTISSRVRRQLPDARLQLTTNGGRLSGDMARHLVKNQYARVWVSLNAYSQASKDYVMRGPRQSATVAGVHELLEARGDGGLPSVRVSMVVTVDNYHEVPQFVNYWLGSGVDQIRVSAMDPLLNREAYDQYSPTEAQFGPIWDQVERQSRNEPRIRLTARSLFWRSWDLGLPLTCHSPFFEFGLYYTDGEVYPCCYAAANRQSFGNVYERGALSVWQGAEAERVRANLMMICRHCGARYR